MPHYKVSLCSIDTDTAFVVGVFSWPTEKVNIWLPRSGVQSMRSRISVEVVLWWGGVFGDDDQVRFGEEVVEYSARVLGAVLDEMRGLFQGCSVLLIP